VNFELYDLDPRTWSRYVQHESARKISTSQVILFKSYRPDIQTDRHYTPKACSIWPLMAGKCTELSARKMKDTNVCTRWCFLLRAKLCSVRQDMVYTRQRRPSPDRSRLDTIYTHCRLDNSPLDTILNMSYTAQLMEWLGSRVVSVLDSRAEGPGFKSQSRRCRVTVLGKLFTPIVPLFTKQRNWQQPSEGLPE